jgi:DNA-binding transcriptional regulator YdaS (Cro superfamily)
MGKLTKPVSPDRSKIHIDNLTETKAWARNLGVSKTTLAEIVETVGPSAAEVRLELARRVTPSLRRDAPQED